jgi:hypothetical protein
MSINSSTTRKSNDLDELVVYSVENEPFIISKKYKLYG